MLHFFNFVFHVCVIFIFVSTKQVELTLCVQCLHVASNIAEWAEQRPVQWNRIWVYRGNSGLTLGFSISSFLTGDIAMVTMLQPWPALEQVMFNIRDQHIWCYCLLTFSALENNVILEDSFFCVDRSVFVFSFLIAIKFHSSVSFLCWVYFIPPVFPSHCLLSALLCSFMCKHFHIESELFDFWWWLVSLVCVCDCLYLCLVFIFYFLITPFCTHTAVVLFLLCVPFPCVFLVVYTFGFCHFIYNLIQCSTTQSLCQSVYFPQ